MGKIYLRPHHAICLNLFVGNGYSKNFIDNLSKIENLPSETKIEISFGLDSVCASCPNKLFGKCLSEKKVQKLDRNTADICGFVEGNEMTLFDFKKRALEKILKSGHFNDICHSCSYYSFCKKIQK